MLLLAKRFSKPTQQMTSSEMLSHHISAMDEEQFKQLPTSMNAVESHNRLSKAYKPEILRVAMLTTYKVDMAMALEHMVRNEGMPTSYDDTSEEARVKSTKAANKARDKRRLEDDEDDGPPDRNQHFQTEMPSKLPIDLGMLLLLGSHGLT